MPDSRDVHRLLREAASAPTLQETGDKIAAADHLQSQLRAEAAKESEYDFAQALVAEHMTPSPVFSHHTAATDWLAEVATAPDTKEMENSITAQATLWYTRTASVIKEHPDEFAQQAVGQARKHAGTFGELAVDAENLFMQHVAGLHEREVRSGAIKLAAEVAGRPGPDGTFPTGSYPTAVDGPATSSERAPAIQALENNGSGSGGSDVVPVNDPGLGQTNPAAGVQAQENMSKGASVNSVPCPACSGRGRVAARQVEGFSGLDQVDQVVDPSDTQVRQTAYPAEVAFPWLMNPGNVDQAIAETEKQLAEREQRKGAALKAAQTQAAQHAQQAYLAAMRQAGYDASGWAGDMGAGGFGPGQQDGGNPPSTNLGQPDPVYGQGGDQGDRPLLPYGADEANDETNQPSAWAPGQPTQMDLGGQVNSTQAPQGPAFPNPPINGKQSSVDPEIAKAMAFIKQRQALLNAQQGR